jgi:MGT family glycosyltransferase
MATVLAYTSPAIGHLFPMTPLLLELRDRGHDVHVRTLGSHVASVAALGVRAGAIDPAIGEVAHPDWEARGPVGALATAVRTFAERGRLDGPDLARAIDEVDPDVLVVDLNSWGALTTAEAWSRHTGRPWATFSPYTPPIRSAGAPPFGPGLPYRDDAVGRLRDAVARPLVQGAAERVMRPRINELRTGLGLDPVTGADDFFRRTPLLLVATAEPFEYPHPDWGDRVRMVGAMAWEPPAPEPDWVGALERPVVLVTTSSEYQADEALARAALAGLADEPWDVVVTMPAGTADLGPLPANARVVDFVPHGPLLDRAVVAVTHGGMGATQKALSRGVPVCVVPFGRDQLEVAARVERAGCGTRLPVKRLGAAALRDAVRRAAGMADGARRVADGYAGAGGARTAADHVEGLLPTSARLRPGS